MTGSTWPQPDTGHTSEDMARVSYLAIRQPAVVRHLEASLATDSGDDGDAFAAGLELACRVVEQVELADGAAPPRLDHAILDRGVRAVETAACDAGLIEWVTQQLAALPLVLTAAEERRVSTAIAALLWALADRQAGDALMV